jgi:hypothetical protein
MEPSDPTEGGPLRKLVSVNNNAPGNANEREVDACHRPDQKVNLKKHVVQPQTLGLFRLPSTELVSQSVPTSTGEQNAMPAGRRKVNLLIYSVLRRLPGIRWSPEQCHSERRCVPV